MIVGVFKFGETLFESCDVQSVSVPGCLGQMSVYPNHIASIVTLKEGTVTIKYREGKEDKVKEFNIKGGLFSISHNRAEVIVFFD